MFSANSPYLLFCFLDNGCQTAGTISAKSAIVTVAVTTVAAAGAIEAAEAAGSHVWQNVTQKEAFLVIILQKHTCCIGRMANLIIFLITKTPRQ